MAWTNGVLTLYHGTDDGSATQIRHGIQLHLGRPLADFGQGFYTTTSLHQARNWANMRCRRLRRRPGSSRPTATVLQFDVDRDQLAGLEMLTFVIETSSADYWDLVHHCRGGGRNRIARVYDAVFGLVSLWPQTLVIKDCDQMSFHTGLALTVLPQAKIAAQGSPLFP